MYGSMSASGVHAVPMQAHVLETAIDMHATSCFVLNCLVFGRMTVLCA